MLRALFVNQFVIVDRLELEFDSGFTVLTGETGAGKSILIDALDLLLGGKADANVVRQGAAKADLSAAFDVKNCALARQWCEANEIDTSEDLILRRTIDSSGKSKAWVSGQPVTITQLREIGELLIDIHGQHAHQALMKPNAQRLLLDEHAGLTALAREVAESWRELHKTRTALHEASEKARELSEIKERLQWKIEEVSALKLAPDEWPNLSDEQRRLSHAAELIGAAESSRHELDEMEESIISRCEKLSAKLSSLLEKDDRLKPAVDSLDSAVIHLREALDSLTHYLDRADLDPARLAEVESRLDAIFTAARKLKTKPESLLEVLESSEKELAQAEQAADIKALAALAQKQEGHYLAIAQKLSAERIKACKKLSKDVTAWFAELSMTGMSFEAAYENRESPAASGLEDIVFLLKGHASASAQPIHKVASGGELSRISLAISVVTTAANAISTLIFDEVDSGIGGNVGHTVGKLLRSLGETRQVLCVTHLPQVAARGHHHLRVVKKSAKDGAPLSELTLLHADARVDEIARMLGDEGAKTTSREHAKSLLSLA